MSGGGVLQHLMAEQSYRAQSNSRNAEIVRDSSRGNSPLTKAKHPPPGYTPPRRALSDESPVVDHIPQAHPFLNTSSRSAESSAPHFASNFSAPHPPPSRSTGSSGLISRLRKEFSNKLIPAQIQVKSAHQQNTESVDVVPTGEMDGSMTRVSTTPAANMIVRTNFPSPSTSKQQLHGHPKSNSAGEEFLYTDRKAKHAASKLGRRRGKTSASVIRSRSLHYGEDSPTPHVIQRRYNTDVVLGTEAFSAISTPRKRSDASTASTGSAASDRPASHGSSTGDGYFQISVNEDSNKAPDLSKFTSNSGSLSEVGNTQPPYQRVTQLQNNMVLTPSGMGGLPQPTMTQSNPHGPYYATVPTNPIGHHPLPQRHSPPPQSQVPQTTAPPRGPPPPYRQTNGLSDDHHPQRPNSLSLSGQISRKKIEYGATQGHVGGLTSPAISTTSQITNFNYPMSAGTPIHGTPFYTFPQEVPEPVTTGNNGNSVMQGYAPAPQQPPQAQFKRSGSANGFQQLATSQPQIMDTHTTMAANNTTVYQQTRYEQARPQMHVTQQKQQSSTSPTYAQQSGVEFQAGYPAGNSSGFSLGKSDSNASTSSAGSRIARRNKRNSKNFSNTSGSSSSTGNSRPNSSADYLERILNENETLKSQLLSAEKKLKKFQNVEKELLRVTEDYNNLHLSVNKTESKEHALRTQLEEENRRTEHENEILRARIDTLTELVETLQSSTKDTQSTSGDIMTYKTKVQELEAKEKLLNEQLYDAHEKISEQNEDLSLLSSSLERNQANVALIKERLLERQRSEQYVEHLSPLLDMLSKTVEARLQAENELNEIVGVTQRPSTSSNDEGISEMDALENVSHSHTQSCSTQSTSSIMTRDEQLTRMQAQMLKLQHMYLETALLRELSISEGTPPDSPRSNGPLYSMLYKHRHAASDPSFSKNLVPDLPIWHSTGLRSLCRKDAEKRRENKRVEAKSKRRERTASDQSRSSPRRRRREETLSQDGSVQGTPLTEECCSNAEKKIEPSERDFSDSNSEKGDPKEGRKSSVNHDGQAEVDSPSEGYHSQQSSGSPTPSSERSSIHFPEGDSRVTAALGQDTQSCSVPMQPNTTSRQPQTNSGIYMVESGSGAGKTVLKVVDV